jgi:predicted unusual protein kinase regulating ubiquinone biosynthesis (AarF/ABC1/UbiB family)
MILAPRYLPRIAAMVGLFTRYGLADFAKRQGLHSLAAEPEDDEAFGDDAHDDRAVAFRKRLVKLGPAYVKLGQVLSTRPDLLPPSYIRELAHLQDDVGAIDFEEVERVIHDELRGRISKLFASFDQEPLGTASLGQVHAAELRDGRQVVVKVQRPGIREQLADDIEFFNELARFLTDHFEAGERVDMVGVIQQLERALVDELDYRTEARNAAMFRKNLAEFPRLLVPRVIEAYSTHRVLTTERIRGVKITDVPPVTRIEHDFTAVAEDFAKGYLKQITVDGHFHADPHPGNVFVVLPGRDNPRTPSEVVADNRRETVREPLTPLARVEAAAQRGAAIAVDREEVKLALIDFGMTARLPDRLRDNIVRLLLDVSENRGESAAETMIAMGQCTDHFDRTAYVREISTLIAENATLSIADIQAGTVMYEMINISFRQGLRMPAELTLLAKALFNLDAVTRALDPSFSPFDAIRDYTSELANERARRDLSPRRLYQLASESSDFLGTLPRRLDMLTQRLANNDFAIKMDLPQVPILLKGMQKIANRIFTGLVLAGLLVASGMLLQYWRTVGTIGFAVAALIGLYMIASIVITDRRDE